MCIRDSHRIEERADQQDEDEQHHAGRDQGTAVKVSCIAHLEHDVRGHGTHAIEAVSYTHLDVYKRQEFSVHLIKCKINRQLFKNRGNYFC